MKLLMLKTVSVAGLTAAMAMPASAMTCAEFHEMSHDEQLGAMFDMGGRAAMRNAGAGDDADLSGDDAVVIDEGVQEDVAGGIDGRNQMAWGQDVVVKIKEMCDSNPEADLDDIMNSKQRGR